MKTRGFVNRLCSAISAAVVGGIGGALLAAFGQLISSSALGVAGAVAVGLCLGAVMGRLPGAAIGAMYGGLAAALGSVIGGTPLGATLTVLACALLAGWLDWIHSGESVWNASGRDDTNSGVPAPAVTVCHTATRTQAGLAPPTFPSGSLSCWL